MDKTRAVDTCLLFSLFSVCVSECVCIYICVCVCLGFTSETKNDRKSQYISLNSIQYHKNSISWQSMFRASEVMKRYLYWWQLCSNFTGAICISAHLFQPNGGESEDSDKDSHVYMNWCFYIIAIYTSIHMSALHQICTTTINSGGPIGILRTIET